MAMTIRRALSSLDLEERILHIGSFVAVVGVLFPWMSGEWLGGDQMTYSGLGFFTAPFGLLVLMLHLSLLGFTFLPLLGGPVLVRRPMLPVVRLLLGSQALILTLGTLAVLTNVTFEFSRMEVRFGIYLSLIGSLVTALYAFLEWQQQRKRNVQELFHHPEQQTPVERDVWKPVGNAVPPPPPPLAPEDHHLHGQ